MVCLHFPLLYFKRYSKERIYNIQFQYIIQYTDLNVRYGLLVLIKRDLMNKTLNFKC